MIFEPEKVKGFQDFLPPESLKRSEIKRIVERYFKLYGFLPVETPIVEYDELMRSDSLDSEDEAISDRFRLQDKGKRNLGLRYELTFQLARIFKQNPNLKLPYRRYQIGPAFRDEPTSSTRFRQFTACDIDIVGTQEVEADAECLSVFNDILKELKIECEIEINNRKLISAIIDSVKVSDKTGVMRELDKMGKIGEDTVKVNLKKYASTNQILTLFKLLEKDFSFFEKNMFEGSQELKTLKALAKTYGFKVKFNPFMIRGLSYYTGNIFEIKIKGNKDTIAAGGRYDKTVGKYINREIPAVGISFGLERLSSLVKSSTLKIDKTKVILISIDQPVQALSLAKALRKNNVPCISTSNKPGKALDYANAYEIPYAIFIGKSEIEQKKFKLKDLKTGEEKLLSEKQIITKLKKST